MTDKLQSAYQWAVKYAYGRPYIWGANGPAAYDCSGLVIEIMKQAGIWPGGDCTAMDLYRWAEKQNDPGAKLGALCFYGDDCHVSHVGFCIDGLIMINASGGDHTCVTVDAARRKDAKVKIQPINYRKDLVGCFSPKYK